MNKIYSVLTACILLAASATAAPKGDAAIDYQKIFDKVDRSLVTVEYKAEMTFMGQSEDIEGRVLGVVIEGDMVIFDGTALGGNDISSDLFGGPRVEKPKSLKITDYRDSTYEAEYIGVDDYSSIAFCRLPDSARGIVMPIKFEDVDLSLGQDVYIFWMLPKNFAPRFQMTKTLITAVLTKPETHYLTGELTQDFIMAPAALEDGRIVGVISPVASAGRFSPFDFGTVFGNPIGIMPLERFRELLSKPPEADKFQRGWLGISLQALDPEIAEFWGITVDGGIIVTDVMANSPAGTAGLQTGDMVVALDGKPIEVTDDANLTVFQKTISELGAGSSVKMTYIRRGENGADTGVVEVVLAGRPVAPGDAPKYEDKNFDLTVRDLVFADFNSRDLEEDDIAGVVVNKSETGGWASVGGLDIGDIIMKINGGEVTSVDEFEKKMAEIEKDKDKEVVFMVWRRHKTQFIYVKTHWE